MTMRAAIRAERGAALVEFGIAGVMGMLLIISVIEFGIETFMREAAGRVAEAAALRYGETRDVGAAEATIADVAPPGMAACFDPLQIALFDGVAGIDLLDPAAGRAPQGGAADTSARLARVRTICTYPRLTPLLRAALGPEMRSETVDFVRLRE